MWPGLSAGGLLVHLQGSDAHQRPRGADQGGAAPVGVARRGEQGLVEQIFPVAGERRPGDHPSGDGVGPPAAAGQDDGIVPLQVARIAQRQGRQLQRLERVDQAEAGHGVIAENVGGNPAPFVGDQGDLVGLGDQIADGQHQAVVADDDSVAQPLGAQRLGGERVGGHLGVQHDHGGKDAVKVERQALRRGTQLSFDLVAIEG
jgi:hypothetical protein